MDLGRTFPASDAAVVGVGARSPAGLTALQVTMSERADLFAPRESHLVDRRGEPIAVARLRSIGDHVMGIDRFLALGVPALRQATFAWAFAARERLGAVPPLPLVVALPSEARPGFDARMKPHLLPALAERAGVPLDAQRSSLVFACRAGGVAAFEAGLALLDRGADAVAVGGIDSYFDPDALEWLDEEMRLHSLDAENGFIPGEGAAFLLLVKRDRAGGLERLASVLAVACARESHPFGSPEPCTGRAATEVLRRVAGPLGTTSRRIPWALTDVVNERHRVDEWQLARGRAFRAFTDEAAHDQPLLQIGDVGAASAPMLAAIATTLWQAGAGKGGHAVVAAHSDGPERGAMLLGSVEGT